MDAFKLDRSVSVSFGPMAEVKQANISRIPTFMRSPLGVVTGISLALLWAFYRVGPQTSVALVDDAARARAWPNPELDGLNSYTRTSPVGPILYKLTGSESAWVFVLVHVAGIFLAVALISWWIYRNATIPSNKVRGIRLMILGPVVGMLFISIGNYDPFTVIGFALALIAWQKGSVIGMTLSGLYLGFQHFEQGFVAVVAWSIAAIALKDLSPVNSMKRNPIWVLPGILGGKLFLSLIFAISGISASEGRVAYFTDLSWPRMAIIASINHFPVLLLSIFAGLWVVAAYVFFLIPTLRSKFLILAALALPALTSVTTLAQSRVFVMTTFPLIAILLLVALSDKKLSKHPQVLSAFEVAAWVIVPLHLYVTTTSGQGLLTTTNSLDFLIMLVNRAFS